MNKKRFTFGPVSPNFAMIKDNGEPIDTEEVVDLLNEQQDIIEAKDSLLSILSKENEQLRQKLDFYLLDEFEWKEKYGD